MNKVSRRDATRTFLYAIAGGALAACAGQTTEDDGSSGGSSSSSSGGGSSSGTTTSSWASGGTAAMTAKDSYPDPFASAAATCTLYVSATEGPCTEAADQVRQDISEGLTGLPMRLALRIVDASCNPIANAKVKIWHTQITGSYSGDTPNPNMCLKSSAESQKHYFRGVQTTDDDGRVDFDSCFPGWYRGRTIHIHFTVTANGKSFTSQIVFDDTFVDDIFTNHPEYESYGTPDTHNDDDNVVGNGDIATYTATTAQMSDGALLASKQISVNI